MHRRILIALTAVMLGAGLITTVPVAQAAPVGTAGDLVSAKDITGTSAADIAGTKTAYAITYLSESSDGELVPVKATVWLPKKAPGKSGYRIMAWNHSTSGLGDTCTKTDKLGGRVDKWLGRWLQDGYIMTATEYAGIGGPSNHAYLDGPVAGKNVLDVVRATRTLAAQKTNYSASDTFVSYGGSQGGHASLWASHLAATYAPELKVAGTIVNSVPSHLDEYFSAIRPGVPPVALPDYVTYFSYVMAGLRQVRPDAQVDSYLTPEGRRIVDAAATRCYAEQNKATQGISVGSIVSRPLSEGPLLAALKEYTEVPVKGYPSPILMQQGGLDIVAFEPLTRQLVAQMRSNGVEVDYREYPTQRHGLSMGQVDEVREWSNKLTTWPKD